MQFLNNVSSLWDIKFLKEQSMSVFVQHGVPSARLKPDSWWEILVDAVVHRPMPQSGLPFRIKAHLPPANSSTGYADCS